MAFENDFSVTHEKFINSDRKHILMITNHGFHEWVVIPGLPDTGGQNVFVNHFTEVLAKLGFKITIINRGGYAHPTSGIMRTGLHYKDENQRILYIEDDKKEFVRKEDMDEQIPQLVDFLYNFLQKEGTPVGDIISHYWDAAKLGVLLNEKLPQKTKHIWIPHSLGTVKKSNVNPDQWEGLRIDERIAEEKKLIPELDGCAATSSKIHNALVNEYGCGEPLFLPPCVDTERYHAREIPDDDKALKLISELTGLSIEEIRNCKIITEISRTDSTKRKDVLIKAFAKVHEKCPETLLVVSIDENIPLGKDLLNLIKQNQIESHTAAVGSIWDILPSLYAITDVYCSPSVMEGFGMSVQEAAATHVPVVASDLIPFTEEYLLGNQIEEMSFGGLLERPIKIGEGAISVKADDVEGFASAIGHLIFDDGLREHMGKRAYEITVPYFTWEDMTKRFLDTCDITY